MSPMRHPEPLAHPGPLSHHCHHPSDDRHKLKWKHTTKPFKCNGCKERGIGNKYTCDECRFNLHEKCASPLRTIIYRKKEFRFCDKPPRRNMKCDACNEVVRGFCYCRNSDYALHPCCANLPPVLHYKDLELCLGWESGESLSQPCKKCGKKGSGWSYRSKCRKVNLHVACAKKLQMEACEKKVREGKAKIPNMEKILSYISLFADAASIVVSALLGDPTAIAGAVAMVAKILPRILKLIGNSKRRPRLLLQTRKTRVP